MGGRREREEREQEEEERGVMELLDSAEGSLEAQEALGKALGAGWMDLAFVRYGAGVHMLEHFKECAVSGKRLSGTRELRLFWDEGEQRWSLGPPPASPSGAVASAAPPKAFTEASQISSEASQTTTGSPEPPSAEPPESSSGPGDTPTSPGGVTEATGAVAGAGGKKGRPPGQEQGLFYGPPALRQAALKFHGALHEVAVLLTVRTPLVAACRDKEGGHSSGGKS